jgi:HEPN domain-containing protein
MSRDSGDAGPAEARLWLKQAEHDLNDASLAAGQGRHALASFLSHQAAEKAVAAYLFFRGAEMVWGHALADLCQDAIALDPTFDLVATEAMLLDKHYLGARYPSALPGGVPAEAYDEHDSARAIEIAHGVREFVLQRMQGGDPRAGAEA